MSEAEAMSDLIGDYALTENTLTQIRTLAIEYVDKQITAERFATQIVKVLREMDRQQHELRELKNTRRSAKDE